MEGVRILCCGVVAPYDHIIDFVDMNTCFICNLTDSSALIESSQSTEVLFRNRWCVVRADQGICVRRIANYNNLDTFLSHLVYGCSLSLKYLCVGLEEIRSLHTLSSRPRSNKHCHIAILKTNQRIGCGNNLLDAIVCAIFKFHYETLEHFFCLR